jgi:hypothetical protein
MATDPFTGIDMNQTFDADFAAEKLAAVVSAWTSDPFTQTPSTPQPEQAGTGASLPVPGDAPITGEFGEDRGGRSHGGIDFGVPSGSSILAATNGTVTHAADDDPDGYGQWVEITSDEGIVTRYGHLAGLSVTAGQRVNAGQTIGGSGGGESDPGKGNARGAHLHFEVRQGGQAVDPTPFLAGGYQIVGGAAGTAPAGQPAQPLDTSTVTGDPFTDTPEEPDAEGVSGGADDDPGSVDSFLAAIRQKESGGDYTIYNQSGLSNASGAYQFIGTTWQGLGGSTANAAEASAGEQDRIARAYAMQLFEQFHSWRLVAIAWFGGPGIAEKAARGADPGAPEGQGRYLDYGNSIVAAMQGGQ